VVDRDAVGRRPPPKLGGLVRERDGDAADLFGAARDLYALCEPDGPFVNDAGLIAEQAFDDGDLDGATPIAWSHALRIDATVTRASHGALPVPHDEPRGPDEAPHWTTGRKFGVGTPADHEVADPVPVWFTLTEGRSPRRGSPDRRDERPDVRLPRRRSGDRIHGSHL